MVADMLQSYVETEQDMSTNAEPPPSYEDTVNTAIPIITRIWRYAFVTPTRKNKHTAGGRERWVGKRISSTREPMIINRTTTYEDFVPSLGEIAAEGFGWYEAQDRLAYALLLRTRGAADVQVTRSNWDLVRTTVIATSRYVADGRPVLVLAVGPIREIGVLEKTKCWFLEFGRSFSGDTLP